MGYNKKEENTIDIKSEGGQLLIEILISLLVGGMFILGATIGVVSIVRYSFETRGNQAASSFAYDTINAIENIADNDWHSIFNLSKGQASHYFLVPKATSSIIAAGDESVLFNDIKAGLIGHWKFDEDAGTTAYDSSGNFITGTIQTGTTHNTPSSCSVGSCLTFDGSSGRVETATAPASSTNISNGTLSAWIKTGGAGSGLRGVIVKSSAYGMFLQDNEFGIYDWGSSSWRGSGKTLNDNAWHHIAASFRSGVSNGTVLYVDGVRQATTTMSISLQVQGIVIGAGNNPATQQMFTGSIDDVRVYNRVLSGDEIKNLFESPVYTRYFFIDNVNRDSNKYITETGGTDDPSTQKVTTGVEWEGNRKLKFVKYITRNDTFPLVFTDWTGGAGQDGPVTSTTILFATSSNVSFIQNYALSLATTSASGWLESSIYDSQIEGGGTINNIVWQGTKPSGTQVRFRLAYSNNSAGPWNYYGSDGTASTYFTPVSSGTALEVNSIHNYRYIRYKVYLDPSDGVGPTVNDITLNWSR